MSTPTTTRHLIAPTIATGVLMAGYLLLRPYGDVEQGAAMAEAFASPAWVAAHILGALALASFARLALRVADLGDSTTARIGRFTGLAGAVLVLPYYGAETFGLHAVGSRALADPGTLELVAPIRNQPAALTMFGLGLVLLAVAAVCVGRVLGRPAWPLAATMALVLPQYFLPPFARMAFGVATLIAAVILVQHLWTAADSERVDSTAPVDLEPVR
ncbi:MAG: hypothetical protein GXY39_13285 [Actinomycetales bacterium]|nr:hypothetical protein [Actinomycetales bacterium]